MNATVAFKEFQEVLKYIDENPDLQVDGKRIFELICNTNLLSALRLRQSVFTNLVPKFANVLTTNPTSELSGYLCATLFVVTAFEQAYCADVANLDVWNELQTQTNLKLGPLFHLCLFLLKTQQNIEDDNEHKQRFLHYLSTDKFHTINIMYKKLFFDIILNHASFVCSLLNAENLLQILRTFIKFVCDESAYLVATNGISDKNCQEALIFLLVKKLLEEPKHKQQLRETLDDCPKHLLPPNLSTSFVEIKEFETDTSVVLTSWKWKKIVNLYVDGKSDQIVQVIKNFSNDQLTKAMASINLSKYSVKQYTVILKIIRILLETRPTLKFVLEETVCKLMLDEEGAKLASLKLIAAIFSSKTSVIKKNSPFLSFCMCLANVGRMEPMNKEKVEWAMALTKMLLAIIKNHFSQRIEQHSLIAGYISDLFEVLYNCRKNREEYGEQCEFLEQRLKILVQAAMKDKGLATDMPFVVANNLRAERSISVPFLFTLTNLNHHQIAFLSTNLPATERQLFSTAMKSAKLLK